MTEPENEKKSFMIYCDWEQLFEGLDSNEQAGQLIQALFAFAKRGEIAEFTGALKMAFLFMSAQIKRDADKYKRICERRAEYGRKGGKAKASKSKQALANLADTETDTETDTDTDILSKERIINARARECADKPRRTRFKPPTVEDVRAYCEERRNGINPQLFVDYYTANGWVQSKNKPLRDWKAAVRSWESRQQQQHGAAARGLDPERQSSSIDLSDVAKLINKFS